MNSAFQPVGNCSHRSCVFFVILPINSLWQIRKEKERKKSNNTITCRKTYIEKNCKMFFIVYLVEPQLYVVIPSYWIQDRNCELWDKFVNTGLNSSQNYVCYWTSEDNAVDEYLGAPNGTLEPNFLAPRASNFPCAEGTFICRVVHFKGNL